MVSKFVGVYPLTRLFKSRSKEAMYTTLLMSTGLTFGSISALFGLTHETITQQQYSYLVAAVIGSAIVPTLIANAFFLPHNLVRAAAAGQTGEIIMATDSRWRPTRATPDERSHERFAMTPG
jgi:Kef-type K+ transport system membrane component KefB